MSDCPLVFFVDPQSYNNLAKYDVNLLKCLKKLDAVRVDFYGSILFDYQDESVLAPIPMFKYQKYSSKILKTASYCFSLLKILSQCCWKKPTVIHVQWVKFPFFDFIIYSLTKNLAGSRLVYTSHNVVPHGTENGKHFWLSKFLSKCDHIIVHHESTVESLTERFDVDCRKVTAIHHGPIPLLNGNVSKTVDSVRQFCSGKKLVLGFIGLGSFYKGLDILVNSWKKVPIYLRRHNALLLCGKIDSALEQSMGGVNWHKATEGLMVVDSYLLESDLDACVRQMDVVVLPHRIISQSGVLLSVLNKKVCFVAADHPGFLDVVNKYDLGWVYDGSESALTRLIMSLLKNPEDAIQKKNNAQGRAAAKAAFSWDLAACATIKVYLKDAIPSSIHDENYLPSRSD